MAAKIFYDKDCDLSLIRAKKVAIIEQLELPFRDPYRVDIIIGRKRKSVRDCEPIDFSECPLAKAYPDIADYLEEIHKQRTEQKSGGKLAHPRDLEPFRRVRHLRREILHRARHGRGLDAALGRQAHGD